MHCERSSLRAGPGPSSSLLGSSSGWLAGAGSRLSSWGSEARRHLRTLASCAPAAPQVTLASLSSRLELPSWCCGSSRSGSSWICGPAIAPGPSRRHGPQLLPARRHRRSRSRGGATSSTSSTSVACHAALARAVMCSLSMGGGGGPVGSSRRARGQQAGPTAVQQQQQPAQLSMGVLPYLRGFLAPSVSAVTSISSSSSCPASLAIVEPATAAAATAAAAQSAAAGLSISKVIAVALGYAVMAGSLFRSVPQIAKVLRHSSTEGLSLTSYIVELCCYSVVIAYNISQGYGFNTFGEVCACWAQDIILIALIFRFSRTPAWAVAATAAGIAAGCSWLLSPACPAEVLSALQASTIATMALGSRLPQIILNMRRGNAGVLSVTTCLLNVAGNAARVFTTIVLTGDMLILGGVLSQGCLNSILLFQSATTARGRSSAAAAEAAEDAAQQQQQQQAKQEPAAMVMHQQPPQQPGPDASAAGGLVMQPAV